MEFVIKDAVKLNDGRYSGTITRVGYRSEPYEYTDVYIKEEKSGLELKYGCPSNVVKDSKLGKLLSQFTDLKVGEKIDPEKVLVNKQVEFMVLNEKTDKGVFARIVDNSIRPTVKEEKVN